MRYLNFDLELVHYSDKNNVESFSVRVVSSPAGQQKLSKADVVQFPIDTRTYIRMLEKRGLDRAGIFRLGTILGDALFPPSVRRLYENSRVKLKENTGLRIRLRLDHFALANIPWEYAYVPRPDGQTTGYEGYLGLDRQVSIVRFEELDQPSPKLAPTAGPLRFVALLSSPANLEALRVDRERAVLEESLNSVISIEPSYYSRASVEMMLDAFSQPAHIFHFAGHGTFEQAPGDKFGSREGKGYLFLEDNAQQAVAVSAEKLALVLQNRGVRLAVLGGCQTGQRDAINAWSGVAPALVRAGVPAVVGMQQKLYDKSAIAFNRQFYQTLMRGHEIDFAVHEGRLAMLTQSTEDDRDWGVPVLYMRSEDGILFPPPDAEVADDAAPVRATATQRGKSAGIKNAGLPPPRRVGSKAPAKPAVIAPPRARPPSPHSGGEAMRGVAAAPEIPQQLKIFLSELLVQRFNIADIDVMCQALSVDFEALPGQTRTLKAMGLVKHMDQHNRLHDLVTAMRQRRPGVM